MQSEMRSDQSYKILVQSNNLQKIALGETLG